MKLSNSADYMKVQLDDSFAANLSPASSLEGGAVTNAILHPQNLSRQTILGLLAAFLAFPHSTKVKHFVC